MKNNVAPLTIAAVIASIAAEGSVGLGSIEASREIELSSPFEAHEVINEHAPEREGAPLEMFQEPIEYVSSAASDIRRLPVMGLDGMSRR